MAKATTTSTDVGLISSVSITADGSTTATTVPEGRTLELAIGVPLGVIASIEASYDAGASFYVLNPTSLSVIDASSVAKSYALQYYTEEPNVQLRVTASGFGVGDTLTFRISGAPRR